MCDYLRHGAPLVVATLGCLATALTPLHASAGVGRWTAIGPDGTNVVALAIDPSKPSTIFAGTAVLGVLKSEDGGSSWTIVNAGLPKTYISTLAIDPSMPSTLYAGVSDGAQYVGVGVYKSTDGGLSWASASPGVVGTSQVTVNAFAIDSSSPPTVYAATSAGVFKTTDGAANWTSINASLLGFTARSIAIDPSSPSVIYIGVDDDAQYIRNGIFKSTDGGNSWRRIYTTDIPFMSDSGGYSVAAIAIDPRLPSRIYAALDYGGLLQSVDGGASWSYLALTDLKSLAIDPVSSTVYAGTYRGTLFRSTDAGDSWAMLTDHPLAAGSSLDVIALSASSPATVYAGAASGLLRSLDRGASWTRLTLGVRNVSVYLFAVDPLTSSTIYASVGGAIAKTTNGGADWITSNVVPGGDAVDSLLLDPATRTTLYAGAGNASPVYKSVDGGAQWVAASTGLPDFGFVQAMAIAASRPSTLYVGVAFAGVSKSSNGGMSWNRVNNGLAAIGIYTSALAVDPTNADIVYVATPPTGHPDTNAKIFKSTNGAAEWNQLPITLPGVSITSLAIDPATPSTVYATYLEDGPAQGGGIFKSDNGGQTWIALQGGLPVTWVRRLAIDPNSPSRIYAATQRGVYGSSDSGTSWKSLSAALPNSDVWSLAIDRTGSLLRAGTPAGLYEYQFTEGDDHANYTGLWWNAPADSESGWGINFAHQGDTIFASWFTYDATGKAWWVTMTAEKTAPGVYSGTLYRNNGAPFGAFVPPATATPVGTGKLTFTSATTGTFEYSVSDGINVARQTKPITLQTFGTVPTCVWGALADLTKARRYQDLWWTSPAGSESGWGVNVTQQGTTIFATWFTYDVNRDPLWLSVTATQVSPNTFSGTLDRTSGPRFGALPFGAVQHNPVGTATFTFTDGNSGTFAYDVDLGDGVNKAAQIKPITRQVFRPPGTVCE